MTAVLFCAVVNPVYSQEIDLGDAQGFNATVFGDLIQGTGAFGVGDTEGRLAVSGNADFLRGGYSVGKAAVGTQNPDDSPNGIRDDLLIQGNAYIDNGLVPVLRGNVKVGGTITGAGSFDVTGASSVQQGVSPFSTLFDFAATESLIQSYASTYSQMASTGTVADNGFTVTLTGTSPVMNVFHVTAAQWNGSGKAYEIEVPLGSTTVINISGTTINVSDGGMHFLDPSDSSRYDQFSAESIAQRRNTVINLYEADTIDSTRTGWEGMFFAPDADFTGFGGWINGQSFLGSVDQSGGFEFHNFYTTVPPIIPEPATLVMTGILLGTCGSVLLIRKKRRS